MKTNTSTLILVYVRIGGIYYNKMKNKQHHPLRTVPKSVSHCLNRSMIFTSTHVMYDQPYSLTDHKIIFNKQEKSNISDEQKRSKNKKTKQNKSTNKQKHTNKQDNTVGTVPNSFEKS